MAGNAFAGTDESSWSFTTIVFTDTTAPVLVSSSPAAFESSERFLGLAPSRAAQRVLAETLDSMLRPSGLSFSLVNINGPIDEPGMRQVYGEQPEGFYINPDDIAALMLELLSADEMPLHSEIRPPIR